MRVMCGAKCGADYKRVRDKLKMYIKTKVRATGVKVPKRNGESKLQNSEAREAFRNAFENT